MTFDAESALIGCLLLSNHQGEIFEQLEGGEIENPMYRDIFYKIREHWQNTGSYSDVCVSLLPDEQKKAAVQAAHTVPAITSWQQYVDLVRQAHAQRRVQALATKILYGDLPAEELLACIGHMAQAVSGQGRAQVLDMKQGVLDFVGQKSRPRQYLKTGFARLDRYTYIDEGDYVLIGGRPSAGKTAFSLALAVAMARAGRRVVYFSLETAPHKLMDRIMTQVCGLDFGQVKRQEMEEQWDKVARHSDEVFELPLFLVAASGRSVGWMRSEACRLGAQVVMVDYLGLVAAPGSSRYEKVTNISLELHNFAQQTGIILFALSQFSRNGAQGEPTMEDLRESGQLEQDADVILLLHNQKQKGAFTVIVEKNKEGQTGKLAFAFDGAGQRFYEQEEALYG